MSYKVPTSIPAHTHSGGENLETMREAHRYNNYLKSLVRKHAGSPQTALDFGAGIGTFSDSLDIPNEQVFCIEPDSGSREFLKRDGFVPYADLTGVESGAVDYLFSLNVLEHIDDDAAALKDIYRVLAPGAKLFIYVPAFMLLFSSMDVHVGHVRRYRMRDLQAVVKDAGFRIDKAAYTDALGFFATLAYKWSDDGNPKPLSPNAVALYDRFIFPLSWLLSFPLMKILGKNVYVAATKPVESGNYQRK